MLDPQTKICAASLTQKFSSSKITSPLKSLPSIQRFFIHKKLKVIRYFIIFCVSFLLYSCNNTISNRLKYIDANKPSTTPQLFAEDFITKKGVSEFGSVFNSKGDVFYFGIDIDSRAEIHCSVLKQKKWCEPFVVLSDTAYSYNDPFLSVNQHNFNPTVFSTTFFCFITFDREVLSHCSHRK